MAADGADPCYWRWNGLGTTASAVWWRHGRNSAFPAANLAILAFSQLSGDQFAAWGWRLPFALSIVLVGVLLWIRLGILETPVFQSESPHHRGHQEAAKGDPSFRHCCGMSEQAPLSAASRLTNEHLGGGCSQSNWSDAVLAAFMHNYPSGPHAQTHRRERMYTFGGAVGLRLPIFRHGRHCDSDGSVCRNCPLTHPTQHAIWAAGCADR